MHLQEKKILKPKKTCSKTAYLKFLCLWWLDKLYLMKWSCWRMRGLRFECWMSLYKRNRVQLLWNFIDDFEKRLWKESNDISRLLFVSVSRLLSIVTEQSLKINLHLWVLSQFYSQSLVPWLKKIKQIICSKNLN